MIELKAQKFLGFAYADDLAVIGFLKTRLVQAIEIIEKWAFKNKITINKLKSGIMIHAKRGRSSKKDEGTLLDYPYKKEYKYLGIIIDKNLTLQRQLEG